MSRCGRAEGPVESERNGDGAERMGRASTQVSGGHSYVTTASTFIAQAHSLSPIHIQRWDVSIVRGKLDVCSDLSGADSVQCIVLTES